MKWHYTKTLNCLRRNLKTSPAFWSKLAPAPCNASCLWVVVMPAGRCLVGGIISSVVGPASRCFILIFNCPVIKLGLCQRVGPDYLGHEQFSSSLLLGAIDFSEHSSVDKYDGSPFMWAECPASTTPASLWSRPAWIKVGQWINSKKEEKEEENKEGVT